MKRIIGISDTHTKEKNIIISHQADIIITAGDITLLEDYKKGIYDYLEWYSTLNIKHKIYVSGNSDGMYIQENLEEFEAYCKSKNIIFLNDSSVVIDGIKIYGTPWTKAFSINRGYGCEDDEELRIKYNKIPEDVEILITHNPPFKILDFANYYACHVGSEALLEKINTLKNLKLHFFGHVHDESGIKSIKQTTFVNCAYNEKIPYKFLRF